MHDAVLPAGHPEVIPVQKLGGV
jgi:hypothetical protein